MYDIYLAGAFFNHKHRKQVLFVAKELRKQGYNVFVPMEHVIDGAWDYPEHIWAKMVFAMDIEALKVSKRLVVIYNGMDSDSGTAWEAGLAYGLNIPIYVIHMYNHKKNIASLMVWNGAVSNLRVHEIKDPKWIYMTRKNWYTTLTIQQK